MSSYGLSYVAHKREVFIFGNRKKTHKGEHLIGSDSDINKAKHFEQCFE